MQLKIASITNLTDARFFSAAGAHYVGFCFDVLDENNISFPKANEIIQWLHVPVVVGEFGVHQSKEEIEYLAQQLSLNEIQIPIQHTDLSDLNFEKFITVDVDTILKNQPVSSDYYVLKLNLNEIENPIIQQFIASNKVFIETAFTNENITSIIDKLAPYGIQITCQKEEKTGFSMVDKYADLLEIIGF